MKSGKVLSIYGFSSIFWNLLLRSIYSLCYRCRANLKSSGDETESTLLIQRHLTPIRPNLKYPINLRPKRNRDFMYRATQISSLLYFLTWPMCILSFRHTLKYFAAHVSIFLVMYNADFSAYSLNWTMLSAIETGSLSAAAAELMKFMQKDLIHAFE